MTPSLPLACQRSLWMPLIKTCLVTQKEISNIYSCWANTVYGSDGECGLIDVVTELTEPDNGLLMEYWQISLLVLSFVIVCIICGMYSYHERKNRKKTENIARSVVLWAKRVTVSTEEHRYVKIKSS